MHFVLMYFGTAMMGFDLWMSVHETLSAAEGIFHVRFGLKYSEYDRLLKAIDETGLELLSDADLTVVEEKSHLFFDDSDNMDGDPVRQVSIFEVGAEPKMVIGQSML